MKRFSRVFIFLMIFCIEVKIHADEAVQHPILQVPGHCVEIEAETCAVFNQGSPFSWQNSQGEVVLADGSIAEKRGENLHLVKGNFWLKSIGQFIVYTLVGKLQLVDQSEALVIVNGETVKVFPLKQEMKITALNNESVTIPAGYEFEFSSLNSKGQASMEIPQAANPYRLIQVWARLFIGDEALFRRNLEQYRSLWHDRMVASSEWHRQIYDDQLQDHLTKKHRQEILRQQKARENAKLRDLFKKKNYLQ